MKPPAKVVEKAGMTATANAGVLGDPVATWTYARHPMHVVATWSESGQRWAMRSDGILFVWNVEEWVVPKDDGVPYKPVPGCG